MKPRITLSMKGETLEIWLNEAGRDLLVKELSHLSERWDHVHLSANWPAEVDLATIPYREHDKIIDEAKIYLRLDEWDKKHFPHVLKKED